MVESHFQEGFTGGSASGHVPMRTTSYDNKTNMTCVSFPLMYHSYLEMVLHSFFSIIIIIITTTIIIIITTTSSHIITTTILLLWPPLLLLLLLLPEMLQRIRSLRFFPPLNTKLTSLVILPAHLLLASVALLLSKPPPQRGGWGTEL